MYLDAWVSMIVFTVATVAFYMLGATVLHRQGLHPKGKKMIETLAEMYVPAFSDCTRVALLLGAWAVLFTTLSVASASHSRLTADFLSLTRVVRHASGRDRMKWVRIGCVFFPMLALVLYFWQREPKGMVAFGGFFQAITLPVITGCALFLRYRRLDQRLAPSKLFDVCLWVTFVLITACSLYSVYIAAAPVVREWLSNS